MFINLDGRAETGVSILSPSRDPGSMVPSLDPKLSREGFDWGGSGLANGFGGPVAPADNILFSSLVPIGLGGGKTIPPSLRC